MYESLYKNPQDCAQRTSELVKRWRCWDSNVPREGMEAPHPFPQTLPVHLFHLALPKSHPFVMSQLWRKYNVSLSSVSYFSKLISPKRLWGQGEDRLWDWAPKLWDLRPSPGRQGQNWVKVQDAQLVSQNGLLRGKAPHLASEVKWYCGRAVRESGDTQEKRGLPALRIKISVCIVFLDLPILPIKRCSRNSQWMNCTTSSPLSFQVTPSSSFTLFLPLSSYILLLKIFHQILPLHPKQVKPTQATSTVVNIYSIFRELMNKLFYILP